MSKGFSEKTLVNMTDKQLSMLSERMSTTIDDINKNPRLKAIADDPTKTIEVKEDKKWIQKAFKKIDKKGTEGKCTGKKFGGPGCPEGSKAYNMAKNLRKISANEETEEPNTVNSDSKDDKKKIILGSKEIKESGKSKKYCDEKDLKEWVGNSIKNHYLCGNNVTTKNEIMELITVKLNESETATMDSPVITKSKKRGGMPDFMTYDAIKSARNAGEQPSTEPSEPDIETIPGEVPEKTPGKKPRTPYEPWPGKDPKPKGRHGTKGSEQPSTEPSEPDIETIPGEVPEKTPNKKPKTPYEPWPGKDPKPKGTDKNSKPKMTAGKNKK